MKSLFLSVSVLFFSTLAYGSNCSDLFSDNFEESLLLQKFPITYAGKNMVVVGSNVEIETVDTAVGPDRKQLVIYDVRVFLNEGTSGWFPPTKHRLTKDTSSDMSGFCRQLTGGRYGRWVSDHDNEATSDFRKTHVLELGFYNGKPTVSNTYKYGSVAVFRHLICRE